MPSANSPPEYPRPGEPALYSTTIHHPPSTTIHPPTTHHLRNRLLWLPLSFFLQVDLGDKRSLYDTPGLLLPHTLTSRLTAEELRAAIPKKTVSYAHRCASLHKRQAITTP